MGVLSWVCAGGFILAVAVLVVKVYDMKKAAREIRNGLSEKLSIETNTLLTISGRDKDMRRLADDLNRELRRLREQRHRYYQGDLEVKDAIANISHDLRTPLTAVCGYVELLAGQLEQMSSSLRRLEETGNAEESAEREALKKGLTESLETGGRYLDIIKGRTGVIKRLTEELFRYCVVSSVVWNDSGEDVILNHLLEECVAAHYQIFMENKITPDIKMPDDCIKCRLNKDAMRRILENIVSNAAKYSDGDLRIVLSENGEMTFSNHAFTLDKVQVERLFDRFYTVDTADRSTGLGLSIAKALTERMGGTISAQYQENILDIRLFFPDHEKEVKG